MKRTKKQKIKTASRHVNSQLAYRLNESYNLNSKKEMVVSTEEKGNLGSIKKELYKSLIVASLILISLIVIYWVSKA